MNNRKKLPVLDPVNNTLEGDLIMSMPELKLGESIIKVEKTCTLYNISPEGVIGDKTEIDTEGWIVKSKSDFEIVLSKEARATIKFIKEPQRLEKFIMLTSVIYSVLFDIGIDGSTVAKPKSAGLAYVIQDEIFAWIQMASDLVLQVGESVEVDSAIQFFTYYMRNNSQIARQALIFLARNPKETIG